MSKLYLMVGLPGSGKSTYVRENMQECLILSSDALRLEMGFKNNVKEDNEKLFNEIDKMAISALQERKRCSYRCY